MQIDHLIPQFLALLASLCPLSLIVTVYLPGFLNKLSNRSGKITTICTTITGTLTRNPIEVQNIFMDKFKLHLEKNSNRINLLNNQTQLESQITKTDLQKDNLMNLIATTTTLCHYQKIAHFEDAIAYFLKSCAIDLKKIHENHEILAEIPTNDEKRISTIVALNRESRDIFSFSKGNAKRIVERCTRVFLDGKKTDISPQIRHKLKKRIDKLVKKGQKVLAFAYKPLPLKRLDNYSELFTENDLVLTGIIGLVETLNTDLIPAIESLKNRGIKIFVLTGNKETKAIAVAEELKIINPQHFESILGKDLEDIGDQKLAKLLSSTEKDYIFSELTPAHREHIIEILKKNGETVAITSNKPGHGIKDFLKNIGRSGFNTQNCQRLSTHALTCKIAEIFLAITAIICQVPPALSITMILTLDLIVNLILEMGLKTTIPVNENIKVKILTRGLITGLIISAIYVWNLVRLGWYPGEDLFSNQAAIQDNLTLVFYTLAIIQIIYAVRLATNAKSRIYILASGIIIFFLINKLIDFSPLSSLQWQIIIFSSILAFGSYEVLKLFKDHPKNA